MTESAAGWCSGFIGGSSEDQMTETGPRQTCAEAEEAEAEEAEEEEIHSASEHSAPVSRPGSLTSCQPVKPARSFVSPHRHLDVWRVGTKTSFIPPLLSPFCPCWNTLHEKFPDLCLLSLPSSVSFIFFFSFSAALISTWWNQTSDFEHSYSYRRALIRGIYFKIKLSFQHPEPQK